MELKADIESKFIASNANTAPNQLAWLKGCK